MRIPPFKSVRGSPVHTNIIAWLTMGNDSDQNTEFKTRIIGLIIGLAAASMFFIFDDPGQGLVAFSVVGVFGGALYLKRADIWRTPYILTMVILFFIEFSIVSFIKIPRIETGAIAALPVVIVNYIVIDLVLRGIKKMFRLSDR